MITTCECSGRQCSTALSCICQVNDSVCVGSSSLSGIYSTQAGAVGAGTAVISAVVGGGDYTVFAAVAAAAA